MPHQPHPGPWQNPQIVAQFLNAVRGDVPLAIEQLDTMLRLVGAARGDSVRRILDLGRGDGMLTASLLDEFPQAKAWVVNPPDSDPGAIRQQLEGHRERVAFVPADLMQEDWVSEAGSAAPFDAIVSAMAIDHLPEARKRAFFREVFSLLVPEGIFINIEHVASPTRWTESMSDDYLIDAIFGETIKATPGRTRAEVAREYYTQVASAAGQLAPLEVQCDWLREIGFENVDCYLKVQELAVFGGQRARNEAPQPSHG